MSKVIVRVVDDGKIITEEYDNAVLLPSGIIDIFEGSGENDRRIGMLNLGSIAVVSAMIEGDK